MTEPTDTSKRLDEPRVENEATIAAAETAEKVHDSERNAPSTANQAQSAHMTVQAFTDRALHFLATASNETLGACLVGLGATTYLVLGRVGLVLIGVVGGVVLHASWDGSISNDGEGKAQNQEARRREIGLDVAHRVLDWRRNVAVGKDNSQGEATDMDVKLFSGKALDFSDFRPETAAALTQLTDAVIRDYVKWWYSPILPAELSFPSACRQTLTAFLLSVSTHLSRKRPADTFLDFVTNSSSIMIVFFNELSTALAASPNAPVPDALDTYLKIKPDSNLANVLDAENQARKLDIVAEDILQNYLESKTYNCQPAHVFLKEILAKVVLEMTIASCSKPEWINGWIVYLFEEGEPELMNAIDAGVEGSAGKQLKNVTNNVEKHDEVLRSESPEEKTNIANHKRVVSKAQDAMDEAMQEAKRLTQLIAEEDARRLRDQQAASSSTQSLIDDVSESTTQGIATPTSSQSDANADNDNDVRSSGASIESSQQQPTETLAEEQPKQPFTSFDQLVPKPSPTALLANPLEKPPPLTLTNANISIFDDSVPGDRVAIKNKPTTEYLIQVEPASNHHSGWMTVRKFHELEILHEILRKLAPISGSAGFTEAHANLPAWKGHTKASLRGELERYLNDAVRFKPLAESDAMKRFFEKDPGPTKSSGGKGGFPGIGWPGQTFESMGKGMIDVLTKAPKEVAGGGKALFGGVTGVLGNVASPLGGQKKSGSISSPSNLGRTLSSSATTTRHNRAESTLAELPTHIRTESTLSSYSKRTSQESLRSPRSPVVDTQPAPVPQMERRPSYNPENEARSSRSSAYGGSRANSRAPSVRQSLDGMSPVVMGGDQILTLPPPPSDMPDDYTGSPISSAVPPLPPRNPFEDPTHQREASKASTTSLPLAPEATTTSKPAKPETKAYPPLTEQETTVTIELLFAVINELYTLSSAWQIRRTLLNAAKTFLLRPGNPQLESIRLLLQSTVLDDNTSDAGIAFHLRKVRENALPTEEELKGWPAEMGAEEKERLRVKARRLLVERGMPQALTSVMGAAASGEALGRVFDCLQVERVGRGVMFGLLLQGVRAVTQ